MNTMNSNRRAARGLVSVNMNVTGKRRHFFPLPVVAVASVSVLMLAGVLHCSNAVAQTVNVPVPRVPRTAVPVPTGVGNSLPSGPSSNPNVGTAANPVYAPTVVSGSVTYTVAGNTATINETSNTGILNWNTFNIGGAASVNIKQNSATSSLLNVVSGPISPSLINGVLTANGIVYIYNPSGIIFGRSAVVDVNTLFATSLNISNSTYLQGILSPSLNAPFAADPSIVGGPGNIEVDGQLNAANGGKIMLFAPNVTNNGIVTAPDGQVIMAGAGKVYLSAPTSTAMRGLVVEVDSTNLPANSTSVTNSGAISVGRGNATLIGLAINQNGSISAQTSVSLNGSIYLTAGDGSSKTIGASSPASLPTTFGRLTLGSGSITKIGIVDDGNTITQAPTDNPYNSSQVQLTGKTINVLNNAQILAPGGTVNITASNDAGAIGLDPSSVNLAPGSIINVSGDKSAVLPMSSNVISVQLLAELADNIALRDSALRGDTLNFDIRNPTSIANISADLANIPYTIGQLAAKGGSVNIVAGASVVQQAGSTIDVSGGQVNYTAGYVNTSRLVSGGALFSDATAPMNRTYSGFVTLPDGRWDYEPGYFDGKSAGSITLSAPAIVLQGQLKGETETGQFQRNVDAANRPNGGQLIIGANPAGTFSTLTYGLQSDLVLDNNSTMPAATDINTALASNRLDLNVAALNSNGFTSLTAYTGGNIEVAGNLTFGAGGNINLNAFGQIKFNGGVTMPGGSLVAISQGAVSAASGVNFNLAGTWSNDMGAANPRLDVNGNPVGNIVLNGGNLNFNGAQVVLNQNDTIDVSGGAWVNNARKLTYGSGGNITLADNVNATNASSAIRSVQIGSGAKFESYSFTKGGTLSLSSDSFQIGGVSDNSSFWLPANYFDEGGFSSFSIKALNNLTVEPDTHISAVAQNWMFSSVNQWRDTPSGMISSVAVPTTLNLVGPDGGREPVNVNLSAVNGGGLTVAGTLTFGNGATLTTDPQATVTLTAGQVLNFDGTINAPDGQINLNLSAIDPANFNYDPTRSIWIGPEAHLFAQGTTANLYTQPNGITTGQVLGGGAIDIGGTIVPGTTVASDVGYVVVEQQSAQGQQGGATFDVSGVASNSIVLGGTQTKTSWTTVASAGGSITISGREGILFAGTAKGQAGNATQQGGTFSIGLVQGTLQEPTYPDSNPATLNIVDGPVSTSIPAGLTPGQSIVGFEDQAWISTGSFAKGGFDRLYFKSQDAINLSSASGSFNLNAKASIYLDAPTLQVSTTTGSSVPITNAQISSAYVQLGSDDFEYQNNPTANVLSNLNNNYFSTYSGYQNNVASGGTATLTVNATTIDLAGNTVVQGVNNTNLNAAQDIRLVGTSQTNLAIGPGGSVTVPTLQQLMPTGEFSVAGNLTLTASQVYPVTMASFALNAQGANSTLNFVSNGTKGYSPLSAAGTLFGFAQTINQGGVVEAPFGTIDLVAGSQLNYSSGSTTSVAGTGVVPFGMLLNGRQWVYDFGQGNEVALDLNPTQTTNLPEIALPQKLIISQAPNINTASGAKLNLSGGGSLYAYEFTAGSFGSVDVLKNNSNGPTNVFAILPGYTNAVAPVDYQYGQDGGLQAGASVYLSGIAGLAAGNYVLLPAHYALLPGAMAITVTSNGLDMVAANNVANVNGSLTVAGRTNVLGAGTSRNNAVTVTPGSVVRLESQYQNYDLATFFTTAAATAGVAVPELPADGGQLVFDATNSLALAGQFMLGAAKNGRNGIVDISAPSIEVVSDASQTVGPNVVKLVAGDLNALSADSLLLGGTRQIANGTTNLSVGAQSVVIDNDSAHPLSGTEILLAAQDNVTLASGASISASGSLEHAQTNIVILGTDPSGNTVGTDGALLRVSAGGPVAIQRAAPAGLNGTLNIGQGAVVAATGSVYMDGTVDNIDNGQLKLSSGAALGIGAPRISLGDAVPGGTDGMVFNTAALANLSSLASLELASYSTIDLYGNVNLGSTGMKDLVLTSSGFQGNYTSGAAGNVTLTAQNVQLNGGSNFVTAGPVNAGSAGSFMVAANKIEIGNGTTAIKGYAQTSLNATGQISMAGTGTFSADQNLTLSSGEITANGGSVVTVAAGNNLVLNQTGNSITPASATMGGNVAFTGNTISSNANIYLPSGAVSMTGANGIAITGGTIYAGGAAEVFGSTTAYAPGGSITLNGGSGNVNFAAGTLDVSAVGASAGQLNVAATGGMFIVGGALKGSATQVVDGTALTQGRFSMDVGQLTAPNQLDQLASTLSQSGFTQQQTIRLRNGDLTLDSGVTLTARQVSLSADNGNVTIAGTINASGAAGGSIGLYASQPTANGGSGNVYLTGTSVLNASATAMASSTTQSTAGSTGTGGTVMISTGSADGVGPTTYSGSSSINFASGAIIDVHGNSSETNGDANGTVTFRAPVIAAGNDVAITGLNGTIVGSKQTAVEGYNVYFASSITTGSDQATGGNTYTNLDPSTSGAMYTNAYNFINGGGAAAIAARSTLPMVVVPGIEVRSTGDLNVSVNENSFALQSRGWDLDAWNKSIGAPVNLTLRAAGNLNITGSISDGFVSQSGLAMPDWTLDTQASGSFRLVGGADLNAANSLNVIANQSGGNVNISFPTPASGTPVALIRTGTGSIDIAAGGSVVLGTLENADPNLVQSAQVYTAGMQAAYDGSMGSFNTPSDPLNSAYGARSTATSPAQFAEGGGSISIFANQNIIGAPEAQVVDNWLFRQGDAIINANGQLVFNVSKGLPTNTAWWARPDYFDQGIATMAGGNVSIVAQNGNLQDVSAGVATNAFMPGTAPGALVERGGGNLYVHAGGSINGGSFYVQNGQGTINAGGSIAGGSLQSAGLTVNPIFALGNAQLNVTARDDLNIETIYNPTLTGQSSFNLALRGIQNPQVSKNPQYSSYSTYSDNSAVSFTSVAGDVLMTNNGGADVSALGAGAVREFAVSGNTLAMFYTYTPATVNIAALNGSVAVTNGFSMAGAPKGELNLLANESVNLTGSVVVMTDVDPSTISSFGNPTDPATLLSQTGLPLVLTGDITASALLAHTDGGLHSNDTAPVRIIALNGDITGNANAFDTIILPKMAEISAGQNIQDLGFIIQNNATSDVTTITAGNNLADSTLVAGSGNKVLHIIDGPGRVELSAGHNIDLGDSTGIETRGNLDNPYMAYGGAAINIQAGTTTENYTGFVKSFVTLADLSAGDQSALTAYINSLDPGSVSTAKSAWAAYQKLSTAQQSAFLNTIKPDLNALFFTDLVASSKISGLSEFDKQIATLFPTINPLGGDINVFASQLKTDQGGSVYMFTPGGSIYAGLPNMPGYLQKEPSNLGLFSISGGAIGALVHTNFEVDQGRVFTLGGGDISLVSQYGDLSAGAGTKTASSAPPPLLTTDQNGNTVIDISGSISGSGIATLKAGPDVPNSSIYVVAPRGVFDAGDAGVRSSGSVEINALVVLNAGNIVAAGTISGVPAVESVNIGAGLSNSATPNVSDITKNITSQNANATPDTTLSVDILGYGTEKDTGSNDGDDTGKKPKKI